MINKLLPFLLVSLFALDGFAQEAVDPATSQLSTEISMEIFSPFCPGKTLAMCSSPDAARVRREIQQLAVDGKTKDEIKETIIEEYGEEFRLVEPPSGDNVGLLIGIIVGLGLAVLAIVAITRRKGDEPVPSKEEPESVDPKTGDEDDDEDDPYLDELRQQYRD